MIIMSANVSNQVLNISNKTTISIILYQTTTSVNKECEKNAFSELKAYKPMTHHASSDKTVQVLVSMN